MLAVRAASLPPNHRQHGQKGQGAKPERKPENAPGTACTGSRIAYQKIKGRPVGPLLRHGAILFSKLSRKNRSTRSPVPAGILAALEIGFNAN